MYGPPRAGGGEDEALQWATSILVDHLVIFVCMAVFVALQVWEAGSPPPAPKPKAKA